MKIFIQLYGSVLKFLLYITVNNQPASFICVYKKKLDLS